MKGPWPTPFDYDVQPGLRVKMSQQSDGHTTILRPRPESGVTPPAWGEGDEALPALACIPVTVTALTATPLTNPYDIGDPILFSATYTGTSPISYFWRVNGGSPRATTATFPYTVLDDDIIGKDPSGLGHFTIIIAVSNACGVDSTRHDYPAQGTP